MGRPRAHQPGHANRQGPHPGTVRSGSVSLRLGSSGDDLGYAIDLGLPLPQSAFAFDSEIKVEGMWMGGVLGRSNLFAERRGPMVRVRRAATGEWRTEMESLDAFESMIARSSDREDGLEMLLLRGRMRNWRFYDNLRTDVDAPARKAQIVNYTAALANDGADLAAAIGTIDAIGEGTAFNDAIEDAFGGSSVDSGEDGSIAMRQRGLLWNWLRIISSGFGTASTRDPATAPARAGSDPWLAA